MTIIIIIIILYRENALWNIGVVTYYHVDG